MARAARACCRNDLAMGGGCCYLKLGINKMNERSVCMCFCEGVASACPLTVAHISCTT